MEIFSWKYKLFHMCINFLFLSVEKCRKQIVLSNLEFLNYTLEYTYRESMIGRFAKQRNPIGLFKNM